MTNYEVLTKQLRLINYVFVANSPSKYFAGRYKPVGRDSLQEFVLEGRTDGRTDGRKKTGWYLKQSLPLARLNNYTYHDI